MVRCHKIGCGSFRAAAACAAVLWCIVCGARAEIIANFLQPAGWPVGGLHSTYQEWDDFSGVSAAPPDAGYSINPAGLTPPAISATGAIVTGTKNIYSYAGDYSVAAKIFNYGGSSGGTLDPALGTHVVVQTVANGEIGIPPESLRVVDPNGNPILGGNNALQSAVIWQGTIVFPLGPSLVKERIWEFFLPNYAGDFNVSWSEKVHSSLFQVRVDSMLADRAFPLTPVPEPSAAVLGACLLICLGCLRLARKRRKNTAAKQRPLATGSLAAGGEVDAG
ncbi:MAG: hypothetical protein IT426_09345 [Pirellulales bacterium]|nr:hypothetical protein [Pirellulales bacterium]